MGLRRIIKNYIYRKKFKIKDSEVSQKIEKQNVLITGANSGLGLALTKKFLKFGNKIFATYNERNDNLIKLNNKNLTVFNCDQSKIENIEKFKDFISDKPINIIINNAGIWGGNRQNFNDIDYDNFNKAININAISIIKISETVLKYSKQGSLKSIINISSQYGSTEHNTSGHNYIYKGTKSLMNSFSKNLSIDLKNQHKVNVFSVCPGQVKTKMNPNGILEPDLAALKIINLLSFSEALNGKFVDLNKNILTW